MFVLELQQLGTRFSQSESRSCKSSSIKSRFLQSCWFLKGLESHVHIAMKWTKLGQRFISTGHEVRDNTNANSKIYYERDKWNLGPGQWVTKVNRGKKKTCFMSPCNTWQAPSVNGKGIPWRESTCQRPQSSVQTPNPAPYTTHNSLMSKYSAPYTTHNSLMSKYSCGCIYLQLLNFQGMLLHRRLQEGKKIKPEFEMGPRQQNKG